MNWGHKVTLAFVLFAAFIMYMVVRAFQEDVDLVADDYYAKEIAYEDKQVQMANLMALGKSATVKQTDKHVQVQFPHVPSSGTVHFYHISTQALDRVFALGTDAGDAMLINKEGLAPGNYRVNLTWSHGGKSYFQQLRTVLP